MAEAVSLGRSPQTGSNRGFSNLSSARSSKLFMENKRSEMSFSARRYDSPSFPNFQRTIYTARVGIGFSPGDVPLRVW